MVGSYEPNPNLIWIYGEKPTVHLLPGMVRPSDLNREPPQLDGGLNGQPSCSMDMCDIDGMDIWSARTSELKKVPESSIASDFFDVNGDGLSHTDSDSDSSVSSTSSDNSDSRAHIE